MDDIPKLKQPVVLESSSDGYYTETIVTGVRISFGGLVRLFIKAWFAWLVASFVIFVIVVIPIWFLVAAYESGENMRETHQALGIPDSSDSSH